MNRKTTVYLSDELKAAIKAEARRRGCPEAEVIRDAIAAAVIRPKPHAGFLDIEPIAERVDEFLVGFGDR